MLSIFRALKFVTSHPLNQKRKLAAILGFVRWQLASRLAEGDILFNWVEGSKLLVARGEAGLTGNVYAGLHEFDDMAFLLHLLRPEDAFFDVGANRGSYTVLASSVRKAKTLAFEPIPATFRKLRLNVFVNEMEERVELANAGVGAEPG